MSSISISVPIGTSEAAVQVTGPSLSRNSFSGSFQPLSVKWISVPAAMLTSATKRKTSGLSALRPVMAISPGSKAETAGEGGRVGWQRGTACPAVTVAAPDAALSSTPWTDVGMAELLHSMFRNAVSKLLQSAPSGEHCAAAP